jgi:ribosome-associated heat shock protein Hsp15
LLGGEKQRVDKWLFFVRLVKSRSMAAKLAGAGHVKINDRASDGGDNAVRIGDIVSVKLERHHVIYKVAKLGDRRGPAAEAQLLYEDLTPKPATSQTPTPDAKREPGSGRPAKKERRDLERMRARIFEE